MGYTIKFFAISLITFIHANLSLAQTSQFQFYIYLKQDRKGIEAFMNNQKDRYALFQKTGSYLWYGIISEVRPDGSISSNETLYFFFDAESKCSSVALIVPKEEMNNIIRALNDWYVKEGTYKWIDYENATVVKIIRMEELNQPSDGSGGNISWENFFGITFAPIDQ